MDDMELIEATEQFDKLGAEASAALLEAARRMYDVLEGEYAFDDIVNYVAETVCVMNEQDEENAR